MSSVPAGGDLLSVGGAPEAEGIQNVLIFVVREHLESTRDRTRSFAPGEKERDGVVDHCLLECCDARAIVAVRRGVTDAVEGVVNARTGDWPRKRLQFGVPMPIRT